MNREALIVRAERGAMRKLPPGLALWSNAQLHRVLGEPELKELPRLVRPGTLAVDVGAVGRVDFEHEQGHCDGEDAVAQRRNAIKVAPGETIVGNFHR